MTFSDETRIMLSLAKGETDNKSIDEIIQSVKGEIDWEQLIENCIQHNVLPIVFQNLNAYCSTVFPEQLKSQLSSGYIIQNLLHNLEFVEKLHDILDLFKNNQIKAVPFKGPVLAELLFGDYTLRRFSDLDIFISKQKALPALEILLECGFVTEDEEVPAGEGVGDYLDKVEHITLVHEERKIPIDLQWDISNRFTNVPIVLEDVENRLELISLSDREVLSLPVEELLCYLCIHGTRHRWSYLDLVCCVSELIRVRQDVDWLYVERFAERRHCNTVLFLGLFLAWDLMGSEIPEYLTVKIDRNQRIKKLADQVYEVLFSDNVGFMEVPDKFNTFMFQVKDRWVDKLYYLVKIVFIPTNADLKVFPLPEGIAFLRYFLRPMRLGWEYVGRKVFQ